MTQRAKSDREPLEKAIRNLKIAIVFTSLALGCEIAALVIRLVR